MNVEQPINAHEGIGIERKSEGMRNSLVPKVSVGSLRPGHIHGSHRLCLRFLRVRAKCQHRINKVRSVATKIW